MFLYEKSVTQVWLNTSKQLVLADSLFMRIQPNLPDIFYPIFQEMGDFKMILFSIVFTVALSKCLQKSLHAGDV